MTITVAEAIRELQRYPADAPLVRGCWGPMGPFVRGVELLDIRTAMMEGFNSWVGDHVIWAERLSSDVKVVDYSRKLVVCVGYEGSMTKSHQR